MLRGRADGKDSVSSTSRWAGSAIVTYQDETADVLLSGVAST